MQGAFYTGQYRNLFAELGYQEQEVKARLEQIFQTMFYGSDEERIYHAVGDKMGYLTDTGNHDVRTEGMSYGMMMCVQLDKKEEFDRIWTWTKTYMWMPDGINQGYFAWSCGLDGTKNSEGPAPDGEEYFAMALFFAGNRWGNGEGIYNYAKEARVILHECVHKGNGNTCMGQGLVRNAETGFPMWEPSNKLIKFIPECDWSDPSYHLPHFYELFSLWANEEDRDFWKEAAVCSRAYIQKSVHPVTGLAAEYADYEGKPFHQYQDVFGVHDKYYSDAYRVAGNIGLDYEWFAKASWECECAEHLQNFFAQFPDMDYRMYEVDGTVLEEPALHPVAIIATTAMASLASDDPEHSCAKEHIKRFWDTPLRSGDRRYYDNCLYLFAFMALSGNYRIYQ